MKDIEIAEQEFNKWWEQHKQAFQLLTENEQRHHRMTAHEGFIKGFFIALDRVYTMIQNAKT
jgi:hypothetical protein